MTVQLELPLPQLREGCFSPIQAYTDTGLYEAVGIRIAFTERSGGASTGDFASLNLGLGTGDDDEVVLVNRHIMTKALNAGDYPLVVPRQVHGDRALTISSTKPADILDIQSQADEGVDALIVEVPKLAALLCFADCVPLVIVSPTQRFAVVHAGWRGVVQGIAPKTFEALRSCDIQAGHSIAPTQYNVYIGPHIEASCFEVGDDVKDLFAREFGTESIHDEHHVSLSQALRKSLGERGVVDERIAEVGRCSVCSQESFFSYRRQKGHCGRHGAFVFADEIGS